MNLEWAMLNNRMESRYLILRLMVFWVFCWFHREQKLIFFHNALVITIEIRSLSLEATIPTQLNIYLFKVNNRNTRKRS